MKKIIFIIACLAALESTAQKNVTDKWVRPRGTVYSFDITEKATPYRGGYYKSFYYVPAFNKPVRLDVFTYGRTAYQVQVSSKKGVVFDKLIYRPDTTIVLPAAGTDTLSVFFIVAVPSRGSIGMKYAMVDADTAFTPLSATPKKAFEQIINATQSVFTTLVPVTKNRTATYLFTNGGFAPLNAMVTENSFSQTLGREFTAEQASADLKKWVKQVESWLKPFGSIDSKFYAADELQKKGVIGVIQQQEIIKRNAAGLVLFRILLRTMKMEHYYNTAEITAY